MKLVKELKTYSHTIIIPNIEVLNEFKVGDLIKVCGYIVRISYIICFRNIGHVYLEFQTAGRMPAGEMSRFNALSDSADKFMEEAKHYEDV
jgi:hypothetical protein